MGVATKCVLFLTLLSTTAGFAREGREYKEYRCAPDSQYECKRGQCKPATDGFQQAESFTFNAKTKVLSACLWTNCYAAKAIVIEDAALEGTGTITAVAKLKAAIHPGNKPIIVSLAINTGSNKYFANVGETAAKSPLSFTAVWGYGSKVLTLDTGKCALAELP